MAPNGTSSVQLTPCGVRPLRRTSTNFDLFDQNCELCVSRFGVQMGYPRTLRDDLLTEVGSRRLHGMGRRCPLGLKGASGPYPHPRCGRSTEGGAPGIRGVTMPRRGPIWDTEIGPWRDVISCSVLSPYLQDLGTGGKRLCACVVPKGPHCTHYV